MSLQDVMHHYQDGPEDPTPPAFERKGQHVARKHHSCEDCEGSIQPGERYEKYVWADDDGFHTVKVHVDRDACALMQKAVEQSRQDAEAAHWEAE